MTYNQFCIIQHHLLHLQWLALVNSTGRLRLICSKQSCVIGMDQILRKSESESYAQNSTPYCREILTFGIIACISYKINISSTRIFARAQLLTGLSSSCIRRQLKALSS